MISHLTSGGQWNSAAPAEPTSGWRNYYAYDGVYDGADVALVLVRVGPSWRVLQRFVVGGWTSRWRAGSPTSAGPAPGRWG